MRWLPRLSGELARPGLRWYLAALALALTVPALWNGLVLDDLWHRRVLLEGVGVSGAPTGPLDLFSFFPDDPAVHRTLLERGVWPWWGSENVQIEFFRPLAALTHWLDYALWPNQPALMHLHSMLWYAALCAAVTMLLARFLPARVAALAAVVYAVADAHAMAASWLASRNALIASLFAVLALAAHDRHRARGWRPGRWLAPLAFAAALLSGEIAVGIFAYFVAYAWRLERGPWRARALSLLPHALVLSAWQIGYRLSGYGASGVGIYSDPARDPLGFTADLAVRAPVLLFSGLVAPIADGWAFMTTRQGLLASAAAALGVVALVALSFGHFRRERGAGFLAIAAALAIVPCAAVVPSDRVLVLVGIGMSGALASWVLSVAESGGGRLRRGVALVLLARHTVIAAPLLALRCTLPRMFDRALTHAAASAPDDAALRHETLVVVNAPHPFFAHFVPLLRAERGGAVPASLRCLVATTQPVELARLGETTVAVRVAGGFLDRPADELVWSPREPRHAGHRVELDDMTIEVTRATEDGRPEEITVHFAGAPRPQRWIAWIGSGYRAIALPPIGQSMHLEGIDGL